MYCYVECVSVKGEYYCRVLMCLYFIVKEYKLKVGNCGFFFKIF